MTWPTDREITDFGRAVDAIYVATSRVAALSPNARAFFAAQLEAAQERLQRFVTPEHLPRVDLDAANAAELECGARRPNPEAPHR